MALLIGKFLDYIFSRLSLPGLFRHAYFQYHVKVRLRFKLSCRVGQAWTRDGGIPQGCLLGIIFIVAFVFHLCRYLDTFRGVRPQLFADNLKCVSSNDDDLLEATKFTNPKFGWLDRPLLLLSVFFLAPLRWSKAYERMDFI